MSSWQIERLSGRQVRHITTTLDPGLHVVLALDSVGTDELIALLDGSTAPRSGRALLDGRNPYREPTLRRCIGSLWANESLPHADTVRDSLLSLRLEPGDVDRAQTFLDEIGQPHLLAKAPEALDQLQTRQIALAVALSKSGLRSLLLFEPLLIGSVAASAIALQRLLQYATQIPVLVVTSSQNTAAEFGGPTAELGGGFWRSRPKSSLEFCTVRVAGTSLRPLAAEIVRRPRVQSLRLTAHTAGHEELWIETNDPSTLSLDLVREARQLGVRFWLLDSCMGGK